MDYQQRAITGSATTGLDKSQRQKLAALAAEAWVGEGRPYYAPEIDGHREGMTRTEAFDFWRHQVAKARIGRESFRAMTQSDFAPLMAEFAQLAGHAVQSDYWAGRAVTEPRRQAVAVLNKNLARSSLGNPRAYLETIARSKFKTTDFEQLTERQVWTLVFDLRRADQRKRKEAVNAPF